MIKQYIHVRTYVQFRKLAVPRSDNKFVWPYICMELASTTLKVLFLSIARVS